MGKFKKAIKKITGDASWNNPVVGIAAKALNIPDKIVRLTKGLGHLPKFSGRIRSNGLSGQFGGEKFNFYSQLLGNTLVKECNLKPEQKVMEVGCGVGRTAVFLAGYLHDENFFGWDVDKVSLDIARNLPLFKKKKFRFQHVDFLNDLYNKSGGKVTFSFPAADHSFDVVFLVSVFTHMYPNDIAFYIKEISRVLKPGGKCMMTCFLMDYGIGKELSFSFKQDNSYLNNKQFPLQAIAFDRCFFENLFSENSLSVVKLLKGSWRDTEGYKPDTEFRQDIFTLQKNN